MQAARWQYREVVTMIYHGFNDDADRHLAILRERIRDREASSWKQLALGFGFTGVIFSLLALIFLMSY
ncbi:hypothetical protein FMN63_08390 [Stappia sp. BW2]|jgi:hypothetical protein|uniref:hypothetical protein n=1 Tax=Stappia sp. BW2 TaxID=2592622 RepID=UPI0011DEE634|nr:hypothetical protein [Stappia sp. BW2]TYC69931.1 hypothetical protein FMN63_08390 [Stappia sp. BW2]